MGIKDKKGQEKLAKALRENLAKRKEKTRNRTTTKDLEPKQETNKNNKD